MAAKLIKNQYRTMTEIATDAIKEAIVSGEFTPGMRLIPNHLEKELNLGRVSIREALRELSGSGLVVSVPNKGAVVAQAIELEEMQEIFEIRYSLEGKASELAALNISEREIQKLEHLNNDLAGYENDPREYFLLNSKFHLDFYRASGWSFLCNIISQIFDRILVLRSINPIRSESIPRFVDAHTQLLKAARARDGLRARRIMVEHLRDGFESFMAWLNTTKPREE